MNILCLETSGTTCGVAVVKNSLLVAEYSLFVPNVHDEFLASNTSEILKACSITVSDLDAVAISAGPGSFTGLRIGVSFAKSLCFDDSPRLISIPTMEAFACAAAEFATVLQREIHVVCSSQRGVYFYQKFSVDRLALTPVVCGNKEEITSNISDSDIVCGTAAFEFKGVQLSGLNRLTPRFIARLAAIKFANKEFTDASTFTPLYFQDFVVKQSENKV